MSKWTMCYVPFSQDDDIIAEWVMRVLSRKTMHAGYVSAILKGLPLIDNKTKLVFNPQNWAKRRNITLETDVLNQFRAIASQRNAVLADVLYTAWTLGTEAIGKEEGIVLDD